MVYDAISYNGESDLLEIRLNFLKDVVDQFIIVEAMRTFSGQPKTLYFDKEKFKDFNIKYYVVEEGDENLEKLAYTSPNTRGAEHWKTEFYQKESIKKALTHLKDEDIVFIGDVDEIWDKEAIKLPRFVKVSKLKLKVYTYFVNNRSDEEFWGTIVGKYKDIKNEVLNHLRVKAKKTHDYYGWHFTNMGGLAEVRRKLNDSYTKDTYNTDENQTKLEERFGKTDYIGRKFNFTIEDPGIIPDKYTHLFRQPLVSIIIPMYNYGRYLHETIQSALNQTYQNIEIICVDDCSSDNSVEVASKYPVKVIKHEVNKGLAETRNTGIRAAKGEYILPLDSDDWIHKDFIKYTLALNTDIAGTGQRQFGEKNFVYIPMAEPTFEDFKRGNQINCCSLYKKEVWEKVGGYEHEIFEDWHFWMKATLVGFKVKTVPYPLFFYRIHKGSMLDKIKRDHREIGKEMLDKILKKQHET